MTILLLFNQAAGEVVVPPPANLLDQTQYGMGGTYGRSFHGSVPIDDDEETKDGFLRPRRLEPVAKIEIPKETREEARVIHPLIRMSLVGVAPKPTPKTIQATGEPSPDVLMKQRNDRALRILLLAS